MSKQAGRARCYRPMLEGLENRRLFSAGFALVGLVSDVPGLARFTDDNFVKPWGVASSPTGPFWFAENGSGVSDIIDGDGQSFALLVTIPSSGPATNSAATGAVFNSGAGFAIAEHGASAPSRFLFAGEDGTISGWTAVVDPTGAVLAIDNSSRGAEYTGLALAADSSGPSFLYAADFSRGTIDVFDQNFRPVVREGAFQDSNLPEGFGPFNVARIGNHLFVTYAQQDDNGSEDVAGLGHGFIDVYDTAGNLVRRFTAQGALDSPWGLALAPADFGAFGGALLVGNNGDGRINAYDPQSGDFLGQLANQAGRPMTIPGLWDLTFGNGHVGGNADTLFFTASADVGARDLFGAIQAPKQWGADTGGSDAFDPHAPGEPGDYPLPPRIAPVFRDTQERRAPVADLLPMAESSLVLAPTLLTSSQARMRSDAAGLSVSAVSLHHSPSAGMPPSGTTRYAFGPHLSPEVDRDAGGGDSSSAVYVALAEAQLRGEQESQALLWSDQVAEELTATAPRNDVESVATVNGKCAGTLGKSGWSKLLNAVVAAGIPMIGAIVFSLQAPKGGRQSLH